MSGLLEMMRKTQEAYCVRHGLPVDRQFSDDELADSHRTLTEVERELYPLMDTDERIGRLGNFEQTRLDELTGKALIPFCVTITTNGQVETVNILAPNSCAATIQVVEMLFGDSDDDKPESFKLKVEPMQSRELQRAA